MNQGASNKEITAQASGASLGTVVVLLISWLVGTPAPPGLEGAIGVLFGAAVGFIRHWIAQRNVNKCNASPGTSP